MSHLRLARLNNQPNIIMAPFAHMYLRGGGGGLLQQSSSTRPLPRPNSSWETLKNTLFERVLEGAPLDADLGPAPEWDTVGGGEVAVHRPTSSFQSGALMSWGIERVAG